MSLKNFLLLEGTLAGLDAGARVRIDGSEGHHGARVMRLRTGESILVTDTHRHQVHAEVIEVDRGAFTVRLAAPSAPAPEISPRLVLVQALAKGGRDDAAVETATELGVDAIVPWQSERAIVQWKGERAERGREKWTATVHAAVKQSRRATIPAVGSALATPALAAEVRERVDAGALVLLLHEEAADGLSGTIAALATGQRPLPPEIWVMVGPEGGVSQSEVSALHDAGATPTRLGTEIMRASSAGPAALAALAAAVGRW